MYFQPRECQLAGINYLLNTKEGVLFMGMGLGKTVVVLSAFIELKKKYPFIKMLLVAPLRVCLEVWPREIAKWDHTKRLKYTILHGPDKESRLSLNRDIYIINYDGLAWLSNQNFKYVPHILCLDELGKMKNWSSRRVKEFKPFLPVFRVRWGLNGNPVPNGLIDLFSQLYCINLGKTFGKHITKYQRAYFVKNQATGKFEPHDLGKEAIYRKLSRDTLTMRSEDYLDLPEEMYCDIELKLPPKLWALYEELARELIIKLEEGVIAALSQSTLKMKLRQFLAGQIYDKDRNIIKIHNIKADMLREVADGLNGGQMFIGYHFKHEVEGLFDALQTESKAVISSKTNPAELRGIINSWNSGDLQFLLGNPATVALGLNLQESSCENIWVNSLDFNFDNMDQFIKRVSRQGNKAKKIRIHTPLFLGTVDMYLRTQLTNKERATDNLLQFLVENTNVK